MADFRAVVSVLPCSPTNKGKKNLCGCAEKANRQWAFVAFWLSSYVNIKTAAAFANWLAPKKDALFSIIYFFGSFCIYYIPHNYIIPQAIPQTHSASYPHRSMWTKCPVKFLVPRRLGKWNSNSISIFRFSFSHDIEKQIWILLFVFRFRLTLKNAFELRFSFFVFASLWKTDMNFVFRFHITLKNGFEFRFCMACYLKNRSEFRLLLLHDSWKTDHCTSHLKSPDTPSGFTGEFTFCAKESNWIFSSPGPKWVVNSPAPMICPPHTVLLFNKGLQIIWW